MLLTDAPYRNDVRMLYRRGSLGLPEKPRSEARIGGELGQNYLERNGSRRPSSVARYTTPIPPRRIIPSIR